MTKRFSLLEELFYSVGSTTGDLCLFCSLDILFKRQFRNLLCQIARTFERADVTSTFTSFRAIAYRREEIKIHQNAVLGV
jgi:hypothetical protein